MSSRATLSQKTKSPPKKREEARYKDIFLVIYLFIHLFFIIIVLGVYCDI
jgi:hypothetical protein